MEIIIIGGGAAGFFTAVNAAHLNPDYRITILEKSNKLLAKVLVSGGGRCNVTHACFDNGLLVKNYPRGEKELRSVFSKFSTSETVEWFKEQGINLKTEADGRMFPESNTSETIANCLLETAKHLGVKIKTSISVKEISVNKDETFTLKTDTDYNSTCNKLIIASGGNPKSENYNWLRKLGHTIIRPVPSLFTFNIADENLTKLMGISVPNAKVQVVNTKLQTEGPILITHWGLSGPAVLKVSAWGARILNELNYDFSVKVNWFPNFKEEELKELFNKQRGKNPAKIILTNSPIEIPKRLWDYFVDKAEITKTTRWADASKKQLNSLVNILLSDIYHVKGKTTFKEEFVTCGGVSLKEVDFATMQSKIVANLYFAGEVLDIDGITGGFNFQSAWTTGWIAANSLNSKTRNT